MLRFRRVLLVVLLAIAAGWMVHAPDRRPGLRVVPELVEIAHAAPIVRPPASGVPQLLRVDPLGCLQQARAHYDRRVRDYVCRFTRQERLGDRLGPRQVARAKFREGPFSVFLHIVQNADKARRVLYVQDRIVRGDRQYAVIEPEGALARLLVRSVERAIDGPEARRASRRSVADFGFARTLDLIIQHARTARGQGCEALRFTGRGVVDGRPTYVIERRLPPETAALNHWPDALLIVDIDVEWLVPVRCRSFDDPDGRRLIGEYTYTEVSFNVGLAAGDFDVSANGL